MDLRFTAEQDAFRTEVRDWLADNVPTEPPPLGGPEAMDHQRRWQARLAEGRLVAVHWPVEVGGRGLGWFEAFIVHEELARARAPEIANRVAVNLVGPTLIENGRPDQVERYLPGIVTADEIWCQLFSEPDAGSDLASLTTTATRIDGGWSVTGQKVWTSNAQFAKYGVLLARTGAAEGRRPPIGYFLVEMDQPGIQVRPLRQMTGDSEFSEVFLTDAWISEDDVVGDPLNGWAVMHSTLGYERSASPRQLIKHAALLDELLEQARTTTVDATDRQALARAHSELQIYRLHLYRVLTDLEAGRPPTALSSLVKLFWSQMSQRMHEVSLRMLGLEGIGEESARQREYLYYRACTIFAGTSEIQRNTLGERVLGLPREPRG